MIWVGVAEAVRVGASGPGNDDGGAWDAVLMGVVVAVGMAMRRGIRCERLRPRMEQARRWRL